MSENASVLDREAQSASGVPSHIPPELVFDVTHTLARNTLDDPFALAKDVQRDFPPIFFTSSRLLSLVTHTWVVTHYEDIREVYQNDELYSTEGAANFQSLVGETFKMIPLAIDPPDHGKYRILLNPWFSPKSITALEPKIKATINDLIDSFLDKGECDAAFDFGRLYPVRVFMDLMGFPADKLEDFLQWEYAILHSYGDYEKIKWGVRGALSYLRSFIEDVRATPADNLTSHIVHGKVEGRPLTEDEIIGTVFFLWVGGLDTVAATTALMFRRLAMNPALQAQLREHPELIPDAIEEFMRVQPLVNSSRLVRKDHEIRGVKIKKGDSVTCFNVTGNFDPAEFEDPREIRFDRPSNRHFTLAGGPHRCLGSHLARREMRIALGEFLRRVPPFTLKPGADKSASPGLLAVANLPIVWG